MRVSSFAYRYGVPTGYDLVVDCRVLRNPHKEQHLRTLDGKAPQVVSFLQKDPHWDKLVGDAFTKAIGGQIKSIAFGCYGGRHRSVAAAEHVAQCLRAYDVEVILEHHNLEA